MSKIFDWLKFKIHFLDCTLFSFSAQMSKDRRNVLIHFPNEQIIRSSKI